MTKTLAMGVVMTLGFGSPATAQSVPETTGAVRGGQSGRAADTGPARHQVLFNRYQTPVMTVFIADADGANARALVPDWGLEYSPFFSPDGQWVVFTAEPAGQADVYRIRPDGSGIEQLTDHPSFDDQGALSPDGRTLAFVSTRARGTGGRLAAGLASRGPPRTSPTTRRATSGPAGRPTGRGSPSPRIGTPSPGTSPACGSICSPPASISCGPTAPGCAA